VTQGTPTIDNGACKSSKVVTLAQAREIKDKKLYEPHKVIS